MTFRSKILLGIFVCLFGGCDQNGCAGGPSSSSIHLETELGEEGWPVFGGWCFGFQAPEELGVVSMFPMHDTPIFEISQSDSKGEEISLLRIKAGFHHIQYRPVGDNTLMVIGGLEAQFEERMTNGTLAGDIFIETPLEGPQYIHAYYRDLKPTERDLALQIIESIRIDISQGGMPDDYSDFHSEEYRYQITPEWNVIPDTTLSRHIPTSCRLK